MLLKGRFPEQTCRYKGIQGCRLEHPSNPTPPSQMRRARANVRYHDSWDLPEEVDPTHAAINDDMEVEHQERKVRSCSPMMVSVVDHYFHF